VIVVDIACALPPMAGLASTDLKSTNKVVHASVVLAVQALSASVMKRAAILGRAASGMESRVLEGWKKTSARESGKGASSVPWSCGRGAYSNPLSVGKGTSPIPWVFGSSGGTGML